MKTINLRLPTYWASYLLTNDPSDLENDELERIEIWIMKNREIYGPLFWCTDISDDSDFQRGSFDCPGELAGIYSDYTFHVSRIPE